ncbi:MAG: hypothetical protein J6569_06710 [Gilliamella sp.]|uniref:hypothetical protein n=1 Tax=Gilliamella sp. TaxID=1891236 RepID=UPI0025D4260D|nr:hypothetical protein [Gilliamella sp.]MCO6539808.1 hypothetical protein [Gilliamella sp.]
MIQSKIEYLKKRTANISCNGKAGIVSFLTDLGFSMTTGKSAQHKIFSFKKLTIITDGKFKTFSIDCGHAPKKPMKISYVHNIIKLLEKYEKDLLEINENG